MTIFQSWEDVKNVVNIYDTDMSEGEALRNNIFTDYFKMEMKNKFRLPNRIHQS